MNRVQRLQPQALFQRFFDLREKKQRIDDGLHRMKSFFDDQLLQKKHRLEKLSTLLQAIGPQQVLKRGYAYLKGQDQVLTKVDAFDQVAPGSVISIHFHDGERKLIK